MYERATFYPGGYFHVYNRGVAKQPLFLDTHDYRHFLETLSFYLDSTQIRRLSKTGAKDRRLLFAVQPIDPLVTVVAYCLMPNHFHLVLREEREKGVSTYMQRAMNSYTRAFNTKYRRVGTVFQGVFSAVGVSSDQQLLHVCRYVYLNPVVARMVHSAADYRWSSFAQLMSESESRLVDSQILLGIAGGRDQYKDFVNDYASYAQELGALKSLLIEEVD